MENLIKNQCMSYPQVDISQMLVMNDNTMIDWAMKCTAALILLSCISNIQLLLTELVLS